VWIRPGLKQADYRPSRLYTSQDPAEAAEQELQLFRSLHTRDSRQVQPMLTGIARFLA
jgi:hypothetical protein